MCFLHRTYRFIYLPLRSQRLCESKYLKPYLYSQSQPRQLASKCVEVDHLPVLQGCAHHLYPFPLKHAECPSLHDL
jgi:hypothetical protein